MTPQEKAKELVDKFHKHSYNPNPIFNTKDEKSHDKDCALICVDEILKNKHECNCEQSVVIDNKFQTYQTYWQQVKKEIKKLQ